MPYGRISTGLITLVLVIATEYAAAEADWRSVTLDNDSFAGTDNGYTNGLYLSWYDTPLNNEAKPGFLSRAMLWSLPKEASDFTVNANTIGQTMFTPEDIEIENPPEDDVPYSGMLFYRNNYIVVQEKYADIAGVTLGIVGPASGAEDVQKFVHDVIGSEEPEGWDTQLDNELAFLFSRARVWRSWVSSSENMDLLLGLDGSLGTIETSAGASFMLRYGRGLKRSYSTSLLTLGRAANPVAVDKGWYFYIGVRPNYIAHTIFLDGNTYEDSRSVDYDSERLGVSAGFAYSWVKFSLTYAISDLDVDSDESEVDGESYSEYGTLTIAWQY